MSMPPEAMQDEFTELGDEINMHKELDETKMKAWSPMFSKKFEEALYMIELAGGVDPEWGIGIMQEKGWLEKND